MEYLTLNNGVQLPILGFGVYKLTGEVCERCVAEAIQTGYRLIDTAQAYGNEAEVGAGIAKSGIPREELFLTTKVWFKSHETEAVRASLSESLKKLRVDYLDMVLIHWPFGNIYAAWRVLEEFYRAGTIRAIGVSNFAPSQLIDLISFNEVVPAVNQIETHLLAQQWEWAQWMKKYGVAHQAYSPLGQGRANTMFTLPEVVNIAQTHGKTPRQIALRSMIQRGISVLPKTSHIDRMRENFDVFDFTLTDDEMETLHRLDTATPMIGNPQNPEKTEAAMKW
ncbi:MAG: aldo/keto reductase [Planctomycetia bacterium]|nr:aldo/keto reductase [Planctomycetia bacterium]